MPVVISLLNALTGLAAAATGFELENNVLIVSGMLVGASGTLLTVKMGRAMNRSITNVLFGAFGQVSAGAAATAAAGSGAVRSTTVDDVAVMLGYAQKVVIVPGTAWRSPRPSTTCARSPTCSRRAASRSATRSTRSPGACRAT